MRAVMASKSERRNWGRWRPFPDPKGKGVLIAPIGPGCYELRRGNELLLIGIGTNVAYRMSSLLPKDRGGCGTRNNSKKRLAVARNIARVEYRTLATATIEEARAIETVILRQKRHHFGT